MILSCETTLVDLARQEAQPFSLSFELYEIYVLKLLPLDAQKQLDKHFFRFLDHHPPKKV